MKSPERIKDFEDGAPAPEPPREYSTRFADGRTWVWFDGGWWLPITLPPRAYSEYLRREQQRDIASTSTPQRMNLALASRSSSHPACSSPETRIG